MRTTHCHKALFHMAKCALEVLQAQTINQRPFYHNYTQGGMALCSPHTCSFPPNHPPHLFLSSGWSDSPLSTRHPLHHCLHTFSFFPHLPFGLNRGALFTIHFDLRCSFPLLLGANTQARRQMLTHPAADCVERIDGSWTDAI